MLFQPEEHSSESLPPLSNIYGLVGDYFKYIDRMFDAEEPTSEKFIDRGYSNLAAFLCQPKLDFPNIQAPRPFDLNTDELQQLFDVLMLDCCGVILNLPSHSIDVDEFMVGLLNNNLPIHSQLPIPRSLRWEVAEDQENSDDIICEFFEENGWFSISDLLINHVDITYSLPRESVVLDNFITHYEGQGEDIDYENVLKTWSDTFLGDFLGIQSPGILYVSPVMQELIKPVIDRLFEIRQSVQRRLDKTHQRKN